VQKSETSTRLRITGVLEIDNVTGIAKAMCFWCRKEVELPLEPVELRKADVPEQTSPKIMVRRRVPDVIRIPDSD
jgi:hypothetical protein